MNAPENKPQFAGSVPAICAAVLALGLGLVGTVAAQIPQPVGSGSATVSVFVAGGLNSPRGLKFGPDGKLYVAEGGTGSSDTNPAPPNDFGNCTAGLGGPGQYYGSPTGSRISQIDKDGNVTTFVDNLPSSEASGLVSGVADVAFIGDTMYAVLAGSGCSHGVSTPNGVIRVNHDGSVTMIADLSAYQKANPVANPTDAVNGDFEPDGTWYSMIAVRGDLYAVEPNHGEVVKVTTSGDISRVVDMSATYGHIVPTSIAYHGNFYVGNLDEFIIPDGSSSVFKITPSGNVKIDTKGFSVVTGVAFDGRARMYVLEATDSQTLQSPGQIVRVDPSGRQTVIVTGLTYPSAMTMGPDGNLYVSNVGFYLGPPLPPGSGQIIKVELTD
ncbi:MAG TPA: ScyD/ScyE family protein [Casimicrobiaceae bacterium]|nr:ScyD/ScyE family protein [Casimicrobiaceae bacterium]